MIFYAQVKAEILRDLHIWPYLTYDEKLKFETETDVNKIDILIRECREKYWDTMMKDYEHIDDIPDDDDDEEEMQHNIYNDMLLTSDKDVLISSLSISARNALLRNGIQTSKKLLDVITNMGWDSIRGLGGKKVEEVISWALEIDDKDILQMYMKKYKSRRNKNEQRQIG